MCTAVGQGRRLSPFLGEGILLFNSVCIFMLFFFFVLLPGSGKRRRTILVNKNSVFIQLDTDQKKHIWFMILYLLISGLMLTYLLQTLVLLYMLLWNNMSKLGIYHMVLEWLAKQYLAEYLARSNIKDYFHCLSEWYIIHEVNLLHVRLEYAVHSHQESCNCL